MNNFTHKTTFKLTDSQISEFHEADLCIFWTVLGECSIIDDSNHGSHSQNITILMSQNELDKSLNLIKYFLNPLKNLVINGSIPTHFPKSVANLTQTDASRLLATIYDYLAELMITDKNYLMADYYFDQATKMDPNQHNHARWIKHARMLNESLAHVPKAAEKARTLLKQAVTSQPDCSYYCFAYGMCLREEFNQLDEALACFEKCIELNPNNSRNTYEYGYTLFRKGYKYYKHAKTHFEKTLTLIDHPTGAISMACKMSRRLIQHIDELDVAIKQTQMVDFKS